MKIWILNHVALKPNEKGITRHFDLAKYMVRNGHNVTIFASSFLAYLYQWRNPDKKSYTEEVEGVKFEWVWTLPYKGNGLKRFLNMISYFFTAFYRGLKSKEKPDVIVGSSVHLFACLAAYFLSKIKKSNYIVEIRDLWPKTLIDFGAIGKYHPAALIFGAIEKFVYRKAKKIIVTLPGAVDYISSLGIDKNKIYYIPNGIDFERMRKESTKSSLSDELNNLKKNYNYILMYVGAHGMANSLDTIIDSSNFLRRDDVAYVFIGSGPEKERLKSKAGENFYFFDSIPKNEVQDTLKKADVLMVSMRNAQLYKYGISLNKLNDYLFAGKPIVFAGRVLNDIITDSNCGVTVDPENPRDFAKGIEYLLRFGEVEKEKIRVNALTYLDKYHNIEKLSEKFVKVLSD